ncbi:ScbR family autoregulator-binding transcription factor [Streptantibioticus cattleyicolor]|uniref:FarA n=1 Tax=Streptantibioticus cattleyicolor (strain ATCC 35852 / DSM 46488 / JCM 4925 / NBRC 14057 / NRRL 8057) TaxID=1003195 RepID=F8JNL0_STREN|nr:ScbR family autoregulator-binding transcription factor [Streptantibioticus cattleyicolor]AEW99023.1 FarA [Streptantibioticus cattleyicolor NRRL 8057 = DSM 46488]CCB71930.1 FarA [Streptantibioticus cattleyicolor NRRL 8057 = DSM 46488]
MAQQERALRTRRLIVEAAGAVFDEMGFAAATTNEIIDRSGVTRGALYFHFPSKEAIADAVVAAQDEALVPPERELRLQAAIDLTMSFGDRLRHDPVLRGAVRLAVEQASYRKPDASPYVSSHAVVLRLLREAEHHGELLPGVDPEEVTALIVGAFTGIQVLSQAINNRADLLGRVTVLWRYLLPGLAVPALLPRLNTAPEVRIAQ